MTPKTKLRMTLVEKHELYAKHLNDPDASYSDLAIWAAGKFGLASTPSKSTIGNALKRHQTRSLRADSHARTCERRAKLPEIEEKVLTWVLRCEELGMCITGELIRKQALTYADELDISASEKPLYSKGWLYRFQQRNGLSCKIQHGEAGSIPQEDVDTGRRQMQEITSGYTPGNIYNRDETSFFYCMSPHRSIT